MPITAVAQTASALGRGMILGSDFGLVPDQPHDQSVLLQAAIDGAALAGLPLFLAPGRYHVGGVRLAANSVLEGLVGGTQLVATSNRPILQASGNSHIILRNLGFDGAGMGPSEDRSGLLDLRHCDDLLLDTVTISDGAVNGLFLGTCSGLMMGCSIQNMGSAGLFALDSHHLRLFANQIRNCGNAGIRIWRDESGFDGTIVSSNQIEAINWRGGGNGQNGNGINIFRADGVIVSENVLRDCAFTAVRANTTQNTQIRGNTCLNSGEAAIFSEFGFSGSLIADNIVDGAAVGITMTNFDHGGRLAICSGNIVRNIFPQSQVNPDAGSLGIFAEADAVITGNVVEQVPGTGIGAGWGPHLRNVVISNNLIRACDTGIAVSVAEGAGLVQVSGNVISNTRIAAISGFAWHERIAPDLVHMVDRFTHVALSGNTIS